MLCCGCKKPSHLATRTQLLDPSVSNNYLYQQHLHLHQQNQQNALAAAVAAGGGGMVVPQGGTQFLAPATTPGLVNMAGGQQRYVGNINYVMQQQHPSFHQPPPNAMQLAGNVVTGPNVQRNFLTNSSTAIFNKQPSSTLYSSMIFPQDGRQSRIVPDMVALQPESFRRVSGISSEVFRQIEAVEAEFDPSTLASQYAEMERRGEMIIRILNPASILPVWLEETCRRYGDGIRIPSWVQFVEVIKRPGQTLGLYIREGDAMFTNDGVYISRIALESPIYQSGCLRVGDEILAVNMVDVQRMSLDDVVIIMSIPRRLILTIRSRPLNATVEHMLPCGNRIYGSESYYDTVASDIYSRVDELRNKPVVVLKQQLEDEEIAAEAEAAEAEAAAEAVAAALDAATVCAEVGLLDAAEIAAASVDLAQPPLRHRSGSLDIYDLELKNRTARSARSALATNRRKLFANTADNLAELAMADAAYAYAKRRTGGGGAYAGDTSSLERPSSRLSAVTLPSSRNALMQPGKKSTPSAASSLYHGRLASRTRSSTGRLLRTSSDLFLAPDQLMDRALLQATGRRHSLSHGESDNPQLDFFLQRYNNLRQMRRRPQSLDRAYKSAMRNSFSTQTLEGFIPGMGGNDRQRSSRLGSMLNTARHARAGYDVCSDTEAYETPSSLMSRRAMTPSLLHATNYANRSSSLPRSSTGQLMMMMGGSNRTNRTAALNHRLAQLEQFYAATAAVARRHTLSNQIMGPGGIVSRPHSAMAGHYSDRDELGGDVPFDPINNRRDRLSHRQEAHHHHQHHHGLSPLTQSINAGSRTRDDSALATKLSRVPSTSAIYETIRKSKLAQDMKQADALRLPEPDQLMAMAGANSKTSSLPRSKGYGQMNEKTKKLNQELNARFQQATKQLNESYGDKLTAKDDYELHRTSTGPITSTTSRPLMIDPSGFQQYGPELRSTAAQHQRSTENQAGYSGLLVIHLLGVRGLQVEPSVSQSPAQATERNLYCVVECDRVYKARTVAVQSQESNTMNFDWDEIFDIDMFDTKEVTFLFYTWNPSSRHKLCSKGTIHLPWISTLRTQHVHAFEMRLYETPGAMLYIKLEFHDLRTTFKRTRKDTKQQRSSSRMGVIQLQNDHPLFGIELEVVLSRENSGFGVPIILKRCTEEIEQRGLHLVGIYRLCGSAIRKKNLREHFERNAWLADVSAESVPDINVITKQSLQCFRLSFNSSQLQHNKMENSHRSNLFQPQTVRQPQSNEDVQCSNRNNVILPPISEHFAVSCEQMKNDNDDFLSRVDEIRVKLNALIASSGIAVSPIKNDFSSGVNNPNLVTPNVAKTRSNATKPQADSNNNIKNNFIYGNRNMINHNQQRQFISPVIKDHQTLHLGSRRRSLPLSVNRNSMYSDVGSSHHISTSSTINGSTNPLNWNHSNRNESNISSTSNGHRQAYQPEFRTIEEQQHTPPSCSSKTKTTDSPILTKGNIEDKTPVMNPNLNPISYSKSAPCNSNLFKTETDNGDSTKNQGKIDKGKYFVLSDIYWDNSTLDQAKSNSNDSTVKNVNKNPNQSLVPLQNCFLNNSVQNLFNDTEVIRREIPSSTVHETELPEFGPFCSDTSFVLAEDSNCSSGSNLSTRNSPESVSSSGSIHLASKNKDLLNHYFNHSDEGNSPPIESVNSASLQEIMNNLISKASISSSSSVSVNNSASTPEKGELSNNKDVNDNYAKEPEHKQQTYTETNAVKDSFAQVPMSMQNGSVPTAPPATTANNSFLPTFQNALVNAAAAAAAMQQSNPHQFGQIFGINYFNSLAAQPAIMNANAHLPGHHTVPHAANPASIPQAFPFQFLASMNQAALAAAAAAVSANTSTTGHTSTNSTINSNNTAQTLAMLAATQGGNVGEFDPRFIMEQIGKDDFEVKAKDHREAASRVNECESIYSITRFDFKPPTDAIYSPKVFLGGVPWDMNNDDMMEVFRPFGAESIQRPGKEVRLSRASQGLDKAGYLYLIFDSDSSVNRLIDSCKLELSENGHKYFYNLTSKRSKKEKRVQVIPWNTADSCCVLNPIAKADQSRTVFLGALHGMMNAQSIAQALSLIFGPVEYVSLDTDKFKYPMGSGQAMFATKDAYLKAVSAGFVRVKSDRFEKTIQIDQFLDDRNCFRCCYEKGLLKDYLRELPEPLFNKALFDMMDDGLSVCVPDDPTGNAKLMFSILECLSKNCRNTVLYLMDHIKLVHLNADRNKMTSQTLAICFGPLFSCHSESDSVHKAIQVFKFLLDIWPHRKGSFNFMKKLDDIKAERPHLISSDQTRIDRESNVNKPAISSIGTSVPIPNTTASRLSSETSMITVVGSKSGPIQISERNPFRGLVGSMNANTSDTSDYYTPGMRNYGDHNVSSGPSSNLATMYDSPPGSRYGLTRNTTTTTTTTTSATAAVTSSTSWISNSSGSSGSGRMLPSTQSATRTISTYSNTNEISHITVPAGATGPSILNPVTSTITSYRGTASYSSSYDHTTSSGSTISTHTMSSNHPQPYQSSSLSSATYKDTSSYYRSNHMSGSPTHDPIPTSTDYSRPYYSSSSVGANPTIGSSSINNRYPLTSSSSDVPMSTTGHHTSESIYSTVNKTGKTTDLYSNDTDTFAKIGTDRYKRDPLTSENDDYLTTSATTNYRSSNYLDRSNAITSSTTTTSSSYVQWSSTSDSSGIGSKYGRNTIDDYNYTPSSRSYLHGSTGSTTYSSDSNIGTSILSSTQAITSPPTRVGEHYTSRLSSSDQSVKPLIGPYGTAGTGSTSNYSSTQVYPTKFNSSSLTSSALSSTISTTSTVGNSNNSYLYSTSLSSSNYSNSSAIGYGSNRLNSSEMTSTTSATGTNRSSYSNI